jgi:opacity protein-like surface antigen
MANGYFDLAGWQPAAFGPFQPYLTAGIGVARNDLGTFSGTSAGFAVSENGSTTTNFAWGAGAGVGYSVTPNLTLDIGYKYFDLGEFRTGTAVTVGGAPLPPVTASKSTDLDVHTIMVGLRFGF